MTHLQKITTLAKKIRKAKPALKWTDAIKQASKQIKPAAKKAVKKIARKKVSGTKKPATKTHKDTKSHNVNIRVVSGINQNDLINKYKELCRQDNLLAKALTQVRALKVKTPEEKKGKQKQIDILAKNLMAVRQQKAIQKKLI